MAPQIQTVTRYRDTNGIEHDTMESAAQAQKQINAAADAAVAAPKLLAIVGHGTTSSSTGDTVYENGWKEAIEKLARSAFADGDRANLLKAIKAAEPRIASLGDLETRPVEEYQRSHLICLAEAAIISHSQWNNRDSAQAQLQVGQCVALLRASCAFKILYPSNSINAHTSCTTDNETIWLEIYYRGFNWFENVDETNEQGDLNTEQFYLPRYERLVEALRAGRDWY